MVNPRGVFSSFMFCLRCLATPPVRRGCLETRHSSFPAELNGVYSAGKECFNYMLFNSLEFMLFLPIAFAGYWLLSRHLRLQNLFVVVASYVFYGWWDWRFLILIAFTSLWSFVFGLFELNALPRSLASKMRLALSCVINLGILGYFKYCDFFVSQAVSLLRCLGVDAHVNSLNVILPVGISFYTFQALSYTIDVYRRSIIPTKDPIAFFAFISFFPQLVAGPIERATNLLPQFLKPRMFDYSTAVDGCRQMLWGVLKKCVVADRFAAVANAVFSNGGGAGSGTLLVGAVAFSVQIYGDFSGYSDIAIGCGRLFGIRLMKNFDTPYFSRDIAEFWRRWHISLTTWFRDYLYIPLGGSRCSMLMRIRNTFVIFLVSGFWHGANWTFIIWGVFHAMCFLPLMLLGRNRKHISGDGRDVLSLKSCMGIAITFTCVAFGWMIFRAPDIETLVDWWSVLFSWQGWEDCFRGLPRTIGLKDCLSLGCVFFVWEWWTRTHPCPLFVLPRRRLARWLVYFAVMVVIFVYMPDAGQEFIYFQF